MSSKAKKSVYKNLGLALLAVAAASVLTLLIPALGSGGMYFLFLTAIIFITLYGDWRSGAFAAVVSIIVNFFLLDYLGKSPKTFGDWAVLLAFGLAAGFTIYICHAQTEAVIARRLAENRYQMIFEDAITGIYETTVDGRYTAANLQLARIFGYESAAQLIETAANLNEKFYVETGRREEFARLVKENGSLAGFESQIYRRDGSKIWITENAVACRDDDGVLNGFQGTTIEITDRKCAEAALKKAHEELEAKVAERTADLESANKILREEIIERMRVETALRQSEEKFRAIVEVSSDCIWEVDARNRYTYLSPQILDLIGYEEKELIGKTPFGMMTEEETDRYIDYLKPIAAARQSFAFLENVNIHKNGENVIAETSGVPIFDATGEFIGYRGIVRNITERKRIENELVASQKQLRDLSAHLQTVREEERKELARELHDELGQLLTALKIGLVRLDEKSNVVKNNRAVAPNVNDRIPAMVAIVDTAMETTRKIVAELRPGVLDELGLVAALEWQARQFQKRTAIRCRLETEFEETAACQTLKLTVFRIAQECLTNIARHSGASEAQIILRDEGHRIFLEVMDNGRGFDEKNIADSGSFGILGMRERAFLLRGAVEIMRRETGGTSVQVSIPRPPELIEIV